MWLARFSPAHTRVSVIVLGYRWAELTSDRRSGIGFAGCGRRGHERRAERQNGDDREQELSVEAEEHCVTVVSAAAVQCRPTPCPCTISDALYPQGSMLDRSPIVSQCATGMQTSAS